MSISDERVGKILRPHCTIVKYFTFVKNILNNAMNSTNILIRRKFFYVKTLLFLPGETFIRIYTKILPIQSLSKFSAPYV